MFLANDIGRQPIVVPGIRATFRHGHNTLPPCSTNLIEGILAAVRPESLVDDGIKPLTAHTREELAKLFFKPWGKTRLHTHDRRWRFDRKE
jgi:hypothetical protein